MATKEEQREYQRKWIARRRAEYLADKVCPCGSTDRLEVDHIDASTKSMNPAALWGMAEHNPRRVAELDKCQILCHDCHLKKTLAGKESPRGEMHGGAKYRDDDVLQVRRLRESGATYRGIAALTGIPRASVWEMCNTAWQHI